MRLFARSKRPVERRPATPAGALIYAIGDVHGRLDLLQDLTGAILQDAAGSRTAQKPELIFVGDYVDRGPDSAGVIDHVIGLTERDDIVVHTLKGNHEETMLAFLDDARTGQVWAEFGGLQTLASYDVAAPIVRTDLEAWETTRQAFVATAPERHVAFLKRLELYVVAGDYVFVHAGLRPGVPLAGQTEQDMLWIRREFLEATRPFEKVVIYGHTPQRDAVIEPHRIGIDTGAFVTGVLTALRLSGEDMTLIQTAPEGARTSGAPPVSLRPVSQ
jgi:serine/threonine protein phosphatase 1